MHLRHILSILSLLAFNLVSALHNVTVDDKDTSITWVGPWSRTLPGFGDAQGGTYMAVRNDSSAYAEFSFTGIAVYFISARWPYEGVTTRITLDPPSSCTGCSGTPLMMNLEDFSPEAKGEAFGRAILLASATGLENKRHTVRVDIGGEIGYAVFDAFVYTAVDSEDNLEPSPTPTSAPAFTSLPPSLATPFTTLPASTVNPTISHPTSDVSSFRHSHPRFTKPQLAIFIVMLLLGTGIAGGLLTYVWLFRKRKTTKAESRALEEGQRHTHVLPAPLKIDLSEKMSVTKDEK